MIVHQCDSCKAMVPMLSSRPDDGLPSEWGRVSIVLPGMTSRSSRTYDLCSECLTMPMTFGNITWHGKIR
jgi:hypothetical protein